MNEKPVYTESQVLGILTNLVNGIGLCARGESMPTRYKQKMSIGGEDHWITGYTLKDLLEGYLALCIKEGTVVPGFIAKSMDKDASESSIPFVEPYLKEFNRIYKSNQESLTMVNRDRIAKNHIFPAFGDKRLNEVTTAGLQEWFNDLDQKGYSHETLMKIRNIFSPVLDSAIEDGYIQKNPFNSKRLIIGGKATEHHKAIPEDKMLKVRRQLYDTEDQRIRFMVSLLSYTGMRLEEVLGLRWEDLDFENGWIYIQRAVVHPTRNRPEIKDTKTKTSTRRIPLPNALKTHLKPRHNKGFLLYSESNKKMETPLSYTETRSTYRKIQKLFELEGYTAHDFRDTCATEWREAGIPTDVIAHLLGHAKSDITENRYVKYRDELYQGVRDVMNNQNGTSLLTKRQR